LYIQPTYNNLLATVAVGRTVPITL
jgi:hypothetical protein